MCWSKVNVSNNGKNVIPYTLVFLKALKIVTKKLFYNRKYIAKITNPFTNPQFLTIIKLTYTGIK